MKHRAAELQLTFLFLHQHVIRKLLAGGVKLSPPVSSRLLPSPPVPSPPVPSLGCFFGQHFEVVFEWLSFLVRPNRHQHQAPNHIISLLLLSGGGGGGSGGGVSSGLSGSVSLCGRKRHVSFISPPDTHQGTRV